jgi:hypothetical protein
MPWIPIDAHPNLLAAISGDQWNTWANGGDIGPAPHQQRPAIVACQVNQSITSPDGIKYKKGMQGQFLGLNDKGDLAKVFIQGVTEGDGFTNRYIPKQYINKGLPWQTDINNWTLEVRLSASRFATQAWYSRSLPDTTVLGTTITRLVTALRESPPQYAIGKLTEFIDRVNITSIVRTIIQGIKDAGLYKILSNPRPFSAQDLTRAARHKITPSSSSNEAGVYARFHQSNGAVTHWVKNTSYCYVGKTADFEGRYHGHMQKTSSHYSDLSLNSSIINMIALCVLSKSEEDGMFFLTEQIFVCLLQTYKENLRGSFLHTADALQFVQPARYFTDMSNEVFRATGWQGFLSRGQNSCGIRYGANCSSPLLEYASTMDRFLYVRSDADIKDGKTGVVTPMAFYRRANRCIVKAKGLSKDQKSGSTAIVFSRFSYGPKKMVVHFGYNTGLRSDPNKAPTPGTRYELVFEVRKDGTPHPYAWARLPSIGRFENWDQANSFAVRLEWEYPINSGNWRFRYLQSGRDDSDISFTRNDEKVPGSLRNYAKAISTLQWLTNSLPNHKHSWITTIPGAARVLFTEYNFMTQTITFKEPTDPIRMISGRERSDDAMFTLMRQPRHGLDQVDVPFGTFSPGAGVHGRGKGSNAACDTCVLLVVCNDRISLDRSCIQYKGSKVCTNCRVFGRPCCTWTKNLRAVDTKHHVTVEQFNHATAVRTALICMPKDQVPEKLQSFSQQLRKLESSQQTPDDGSDCEDDEGPEEVDFDNLDD